MRLALFQLLYNSHKLILLWSVRPFFSKTALLQWKITNNKCFTEVHSSSKCCCRVLRLLLQQPIDTCTAVACVYTSLILCYYTYFFFNEQLSSAIVKVFSFIFLQDLIKIKKRSRETHMQLRLASVCIRYFIRVRRPGMIKQLVIACGNKNMLPFK